jgi:hypothetical protein
MKVPCRAGLIHVQQSGTEHQPIETHFVWIHTRELKRTRPAAGRPPLILAPILDGFWLEKQKQWVMSQFTVMLFPVVALFSRKDETFHIQGKKHHVFLCFLKQLLRDNSGSFFCQVLGENLVYVLLTQKTTFCCS